MVPAPPAPASLAAGHSQAVAEPSDTPALSYVHLQLRGAVLLEHRVGQLLQKCIFRAHQLPRERRRPTDAWGSGHRPGTARLPGSRSRAHGAVYRARAPPGARVLSAQHFSPGPSLRRPDHRPRPRSRPPQPPSLELRLPDLASLRARPLHQSETGKEPAARLLVDTPSSLRRRLFRLVQSVALPPTTPQAKKRAPEPQRAQKSEQRRRRRQGKASGGSGTRLTPTRMVAVFRPGCLSSGRNTDIPGPGRSATVGRARILQTTRRHAQRCAADRHVTPAWAGLWGTGRGPLKGTLTSLFKPVGQALYFTPQRKKVIQ